MSCAAAISASPIADGTQAPRRSVRQWLEKLNGFAIVPRLFRSAARNPYSGTVTYNHHQPAQQLTAPPPPRQSESRRGRKLQQPNDARISRANTNPESARGLLSPKSELARRVSQHFRPWRHLWICLISRVLHSKRLLAAICNSSGTMAAVSHRAPFVRLPIYSPAPLNCLRQQVANPAIYTSANPTLCALSFGSLPTSLPDAAVPPEFLEQRSAAPMVSTVHPQRRR